MGLTGKDRPALGTIMLKRLLNCFSTPLPHPIDVRLGVETSGTISPNRLRAGRGLLDTQNVGYAGSQPSVIGKAMNALYDAHEAAGEDFPEEFIDLGCGKGRALIAVREWPFAYSRGIELDPGLAAIARANADHLGGDIEPPFEVIIGDASQPEISPTADTVFYLYNSFGDALVDRLLDHLEAHIKTHPDQRLWLALYNPVRASLVDARAAVFERFFADRIAFSEEEAMAHTFDNRADSVVIWQSKSSRMLPPLPGHDREVLITVPGLGADVQ